MVEILSDSTRVLFSVSVLTGNRQRCSTFLGDAALKIMSELGFENNLLTSLRPK